MDASVLHDAGLRVGYQARQVRAEIDHILRVLQTRLDKHDADLYSQRQLQEDLKTEISLLRKTASTVARSVATRQAIPRPQQDPRNRSVACSMSS